MGLIEPGGLGSFLPSRDLRPLAQHARSPQLLPHLMEEIAGTPEQAVTNELSTGAERPGIVDGSSRQGVMVQTRSLLVWLAGLLLLVILQRPGLGFAFACSRLPSTLRTPLQGTRCIGLAQHWRSENELSESDLKLGTCCACQKTCESLNRSVDARCRLWKFTMSIGWSC